MSRCLNYPKLYIICPVPNLSEHLLFVWVWQWSCWAVCLVCLIDFLYSVNYETCACRCCLKTGEWRAACALVSFHFTVWNWLSGKQQPCLCMCITEAGKQQPCLHHRSNSNSRADEEQQPNLLLSAIVSTFNFVCFTAACLYRVQHGHMGCGLQFTAAIVLCTLFHFLFIAVWHWVIAACSTRTRSRRIIGYPNFRILAYYEYTSDSGSQNPNFLGYPNTRPSKSRSTF